MYLRRPELVIGANWMHPMYVLAESNYKANVYDQGEIGVPHYYPASKIHP